MTPLFQKIARELTLPLKERTFEDNCGLLRMLDDAHCFEVTEVHSMAYELAQQIYDQSIRGQDNPKLNLMNTQSFLPAPKTWIERRILMDGKYIGREGYLLTHNPIERHAAVYGAWHVNKFFKSSDVDGRILLIPKTDDMLNPDWSIFPTFSFIPQGNGYAHWQTLITYALLAIINTPRIVGRKQHMPHRGLERALTKALGVGSFPLRAWTELVLSMKFKEMGGEEHEAHLTGQRCLHFCRAHLRVREGQLQFVRAHWRGDPALGMKRTRYRLTN